MGWTRNEYLLNLRDNEGVGFFMYWYYPIGG